MDFLLKIVAAVVSVLFSFTSVISPMFGQELKTKSGENCKLCFSVISDTHVSESAPRKTDVEQAFRDMSKDCVDAVVVCGDISDHGEPEHYNAFYDAAKSGLRGPQLICAVGNHDNWTSSVADDDYAHCSDAFINAYNDYSGRGLEKAYYSTVINGYTFICLASEYSHVDAYISDTQMQWFDAQLAEATADGKPVFVVCHWPINGTTGQPIFWEEGGMGAQSDEVEAIMNKYDNVFYLSGHTHIGLRGSLANKINGAQTIEKRGKVWYVNLPSYLFTNGDGFLEGKFSFFPRGCGFVVEVCDDSVSFRARNFSLQYWLPIFDSTIDLKTSERIK